MAQQNIIKEHQWQHRLILVFAPSALDKQAKAQSQLFAADPIGLKERDLFIFTIFENSGTKPDEKSIDASTVHMLRANYQIKSMDFTVVLIGKDGGEKWRQSEVTTLETLYNIIDAMPMRRQEMEQLKKKGRHQN